MIQAENKSHISEDICFLARVDNHPWTYVFDCGMARYLGASDCKSMGALFVTHTHMDHFSNFDTILRHQLGVRRKITICGPKGIAKNVQAKALSYTWNLIRGKTLIYEIHELNPTGYDVFVVSPPKWELKKVDECRVVDGVCFRSKGVSAKYALLDHKIDSVAYLLEEDSVVNIDDFPFRPGPWIRDLKEAHADEDTDREIRVSDTEVLKAGELFKYLYVKQGKRFGYAMDHLASEQNHEKLIALWKDADEVVIEGFFRDCDRSYALKHFHSTAAESGKVARLAGVKKLTMAHHSRRYAREIADLLEEGRAAFEGREARFDQKPVSRYGQNEDFDE